MKTIYKYKLILQEQNLIELPIGGKILDFVEKHGDLFIWVLVDSTAKLTAVDFRIYGTGHELPNSDKLKYVKTCHTLTGYVWHLFQADINT